MKTANKLNLSKPVKFVDPQEGEENMIFDITNYNEVTQRVLIRPRGYGQSLVPIELVSINHVTNI